MERTELAYKIINFFETKGLTEEKKATILTKIANCSEDELASWKFIAEKIDNHEIRIATTLQNRRERKFKKIAYWKNLSVDNVGINIVSDGLTGSLDDFLDRQLKEIFDDHYE